MKKGITLILTLAMLICLGGCGDSESQETSTPAPVEEPQKEAEYVETSVDLPEGSYVKTGFNEENEPYIFMYDEEKTTDKATAYKKYVYRGNQWQEEDISSLNSLLEKEKILYVYTFEYTPDGKLYGIQPEFNEMATKVEVMRVFEVLENKIKKYETNVLSEEERKIKNFQFLGEEKLCVLYEDGNIVQYDLITGDVVKDYGKGFASLQVIEDCIYAMSNQNDAILEVNLSSGKIDRKYSWAHGMSYPTICQDEDGNRYAYSLKGIFQLENEELIEVVNESKMSVNMMGEEAYVSHMGVKDETFYCIYLMKKENSMQYRMATYGK